MFEKSLWTKIFFCGIFLFPQGPFQLKARVVWVPDTFCMFTVFSNSLKHGNPPEMVQQKLVRSGVRPWMRTTSPACGQTQRPAG